MNEAEFRQAYEKTLCDCGWDIKEITDDNFVEIGVSIGGEDFRYQCGMNNFLEKVVQFAKVFDVDKHVARWLNYKLSGEPNIPSARELVNNAEAIAGLLQNLAAALTSKGEVTLTEIEP